MKTRIVSAVIVCLLIATSTAAADLGILKAQVEKTILRARGDVGVAIKHVESGMEVMINAEGRYPMASTFKLPILVEIYHQIAEGKMTLDDRVEILPEHLHVGSGIMIAQFDPPGVQLSIRNLINLMMRVSDNSAADILLDRVGASNVTARMKTLGLDSIRVDRSTQELILDQSGVDFETYGKLPVRELRKVLDAVDPAAAARANEQFSKVDKDMASPGDFNRLLEMIHLGQIVSREASDEIIGILKEIQSGFGRIPGLLPPETVTARKTGTIGGTVNDTGIVVLPFDAGHLLITVFMKDARASTPDRERVIAEVSRYAYDYFIFTQGKLQ